MNIDTLHYLFIKRNKNLKNTQTAAKRTNAISETLNFKNNNPNIGDINKK